MEKRLFGGICALCFIASGVLEGGLVEWPPADGGNGHHYEAVVAPEGIFWSQAEAAARARGGHLATITSPEENAFVHRLITDSLYWNQDRWGPWLGGFQPAASTEPDGGWQWVTGEPFTYTNWTAGQPDEFDPNESCLHFGATPLGKVATWNDLQDRYTYAPIKGYVVEYEEATYPVRWFSADGGNGHSYKAVAVAGGITWDAARQAAEMAGGYLATVTSEQENGFVFGLVTDERFWRQTAGGVAGPWLGGFQGQASDIEIHAREILYLRGRLNELLAKHTGQTVEQIEKDTDRDNFMSATAAVEYGLVDQVLTSRSES